MAHFADPNRCPSCAGAIVGPVCPTCGLRLVGTTAGELFQTLQHADTLLDRLRAESASAVPPVEVRADLPPVEVRADLPPVEVRAQRASKPTTRRVATVPAVLLALGGIALAAGALVFVVAAWIVLGVAGRSVALVVLTAGLGVGVDRSARRGLDATAQTLATLTALFAAFDLLGIRKAWLHDVAVRPYTIAAGVVLAAGCAAAVLVMRPRLRLWGPELVGSAALAIAALATLATDEHPPVAMTAVMVLGAAAAWAARRVRLQTFAATAAAVAVVGWVLLIVYGVVITAIGELSRWSTIGPLGTAGLAAAAVAVLAPRARPYAGTVAVWLLVAAAVGWTDWFQTPAWFLLTVAVVAAAGCAVWTGPWRTTGIGVGATGTVVLLTAAAAWTVELAEGVAHAVARADPDQSTGGWATRFVADHDVPAWPALLALGLLLGLGVHVRGRRVPASSITAAVVATGLATAGYAHWSLVPAGFALVAALVEGLLALRGERWHWAVAGVLAAVAAGCAAVGSGPESVVWWAVAALGVVVLLEARTPDHLPAAALVPCLLAGALLLDGAAFDLERRWMGMGAIVLVYAAALTLRPRAARPALAAGSLVAMLGSAAVGTTSAGWLAAELTVIAAGCAIASILDRSRLEGAVATVVGLAALWLRLGASDVHTPEAYSLPLAAVVLLVGAWALRDDRTRRTVPTIGTGLALALVPTWALGVAHPLSVRAVVAGLACAALVAAGASLRWMAPLLLGAVTGTVLVLVELAPYVYVVPQWVLLVAIGAALLAAGIRWEALAAAGRRTWGRVAELR